jgi:ATP-dependent DNA helicase RecG
MVKRESSDMIEQPDAEQDDTGSISNLIKDRAVTSAKGNSMIANPFYCMTFIKRRGIKLAKILSETAKLSGCEDCMKPVFCSRPSDFRVVLKNVNYSFVAITLQVRNVERLLQCYYVPREKREIVAKCTYSYIKCFTKGFLKPLLESARL